MADETVITQAMQGRPFALFARRCHLAITNSRILFFRRGLFGGYRMADVQWKDLADARIEQNVAPSLCGSNLLFTHLLRGAPIFITGLPSDKATAIYAKAQQEEQAWEEKRRVRAMEETRARAGGVVVNAAPAQSAAPAAASNDVMKELEKAKQLLDMGALSDAEFQEMKAKIISRA
jgi:hypothetical protein